MPPDPSHPVASWPSMAVGDLEQMFGAATKPGLMGFVTLDHPEWVSAADAQHVRDHDLAFCFVTDAGAYCVPMFVVDYYHTINTELGGEPVVLVSCDRCASSGAWRSRIDDGRVLRFHNWGIFEAQLAWRDDETNSIWLHSTAVAVAGELEGVGLPTLAAVVQMTFGQWRAHYPDTVVLNEVHDDVSHRDMRHGHGREEVFERPGVGAQERDYFFKTVSRPWDTRLSEQHMVLGIGLPNESKTYPWRAVKHEGHVINDVVADVPVVVWCDPAPDSAACAAFDRRVDEQVLEFALRDGEFEDVTTGSRWNLNGRCTSGPLAGRQLDPVRYGFKRWFSWSSSHPDVALFTSTRRIPEESGWGVVAGDLAPIIDALAASGLDVLVDEEIVQCALPPGAERGLVLRINGDPFWLWRTATPEHARDLVALPREYQTQPRGLRHGRFVLEDATPERWTEWTHSVLLPDEQIPWSSLDLEAVRGTFAAAADAIEPSNSESGVALSDVLSALAAGGNACDDGARLLPPSSLEPGCDASAELSFGPDRMILYRYASPTAASVAAKRMGHCVTSGRFVLRSTPLNMYRLRSLEIALRSEQNIQWAPRIDDEQFAQAFADAAREAGESQ
jgi:hypothetical protein